MLFGQYASRRSEAYFPTLWEALELAWCPAIVGANTTTQFDLSGMENHGTPRNSPTLTNVRGMMFATLNGSDQYVEMSRGISSLTGATKLSVSAWIKTSKVNQEIVTDWRSGGAANHFELWILGNGHPAFYLYSGGGGYAIREATLAVHDGLPHHVCGVFGNGALNIYVDGVLKSGGLTSAIPSALNPAASVSVEIGRYRDGGYFTGSIGEVLLHSRDLTADEILILASIPGAWAAPRAAFPSGAQTLFRRSLADRIGSRGAA